MMIIIIIGKAAITFLRGFYLICHPIFTSLDFVSVFSLTNWFLTLSVFRCSEEHIVSFMFVSVLQNTGRWTKSENSLIPSSCHNPLESNIFFTAQGRQSCVQPQRGDQVSVFMFPNDKVAQLYPQEIKCLKISVDSIFLHYILVHFTI